MILQNAYVPLPSQLMSGTLEDGLFRVRRSRSHASGVVVGGYQLILSHRFAVARLNRIRKWYYKLGVII
jgi:hypothetical protein